MAVSEQVAEPWVAMGYYCLSTKKATRAVYFAQKVCLPSVNFFIKHDANGAFVLTETRPIKMDYIVEVFILHRDPSAIVYKWSQSWCRSRSLLLWTDCNVPDKLFLKNSLYVEFYVANIYHSRHLLLMEETRRHCYWKVALYWNWRRYRMQYFITEKLWGWNHIDTKHTKVSTLRIHTDGYKSEIVTLTVKVSIKNKTKKICFTLLGFIYIDKKGKFITLCYLK